MYIALKKLYVKFQSNPLKIFWDKVEKVQKTHEICLIMQLIPLNSFLEKIIFDPQTSIPRVYPVKFQVIHATTSLLT